jgi:predicted transcriptional regulator
MRLNTRDFDVLKALERKAPRGVADIAIELEISTAEVRTVLSNLHSKKLVREVPGTGGISEYEVDTHEVERSYRRALERQA